jgi:sensor histidine kinase regulating citrate/malate metabolism
MQATWIWALAFVVVLAALTFVFLRVVLPRVTDRRLERFQNDLLARHTEEVQNIYQKMRGWRHDYKNHIQAMKAHLTLGQLEALGAYLDMLDEDLESVDTVLRTGNIQLDAVLNSKLSLISSKNIGVNAKAQVPEKLTVNEVDLCVVVGNLLNNAMESCEKIPRKEDRFIRIYIGTLKQQLYISVTNAAAGELRKAGAGRYLTTKGAGRGFGLGRIDALVTKHGGYVNRQHEEGVFATEILLPL